MKLETRIKIKISIRSLHSFYERNLFAQYFTVYKRDVKRKRNASIKHKAAHFHPLKEITSFHVPLHIYIYIYINRSKIKIKKFP